MIRSRDGASYKEIKKINGFLAFQIIKLISDNVPRAKIGQKSLEDEDEWNQENSC